MLREFAILFEDMPDGCSGLGKAEIGAIIYDNKIFIENLNCQLIQPIANHDGDYGFEIFPNHLMIHKDRVKKYSKKLLTYAS